MNDHVSIELPDRGPSLRAAAVSVAVAWLAAVVGVVLAIMRGDGLVATYALLTTITSAGWWIAVLRWSEWRTITMGMLALLERAARRDEP